MSRSGSDSDLATSLLGTYMLQGWVMTDELCQQSGCSVPMMRSKDGLIKFCVSHDSLPTSSSGQRKPATPISSAPPANTTPTPPAASTSAATTVKPAPKASAPVSDSRTEDVKSMDKMREQSERREQSSKASQLIGQKLLQRWTLLNDICPNSDCYAVPLMRNPVNKHMVCVICNQTYITEQDASAMNFTKNDKPVPERKPEPEPELESEPDLESEHEMVLSELSETRSFCFEDAVEEAIEDRPRNVSTQNSRPVTKAPSPKLGPSSTAPTATTNISFISKRAGFETEYFGQQGIVKMLSLKLSKMTNEVMECDDPTQAASMFSAIETCAKAIEACVQAGEACSDASKKRY
ncbi:hypothetical protein J3Q64DRAFT_1751075 [Phycomyces blakesleeanus]|uniref:Sjogrens syndrome scleroderma autoantigen 1 family protein n=1 Tax=Phycomyces blakesleeanus TaxID=4837 RepID=A0ABR3AV36_PHYBL